MLTIIKEKNLESLRGGKEDEPEIGGIVRGGEPAMRNNRDC